MSNQGYGRNPYWAPEYTGLKPSFNDMGAMRLNPDNVLNWGLVAWWLMNEGAGKSLYSIVSPVVTYPSAYFPPFGGNTLNLTATSSHFVRFSDADWMTPIKASPGMTVVVRFRWNVLAASRCIIGKTAVDQFDWQLRSTSTSSRVGMYMGSTAAGNYSSCEAGLEADVFYTIACVYDGTKAAGSKMQFFKNGVKLALVAAESSAPTTTPNTAKQIYFGYDGYGIAYSNISYETASLYSRALSDKEASLATIFPYGTPSDPRFLVMPQRTWFVPSAGAPPAGLYGPLLNTQLLNSPLISGRLVQ
jgi:hypothetical protein